MRNRLINKEKVECAKKQIELNGDLCDDSVFQLVKLGELEDIEEKRGIDIRILDQALENGAYFKNPYHSGEKVKYFNNLCPRLDWKNNRFDIKMFLFVLPSDYSTGGAFFSFKDYGKTWALTKEELE